MKTSISILVDVQKLDKAKDIAGELVAMFNQDLGEDGVPFIVTMENKDKGILVSGFYQDEHEIELEHELEAGSIIDEIIAE